MNIINSINRLNVVNYDIVNDIREFIQNFKKKHLYIEELYKMMLSNFIVFLEDNRLELNEIENIPEYKELPYQFEMDKLK